VPVIIITISDEIYVTKCNIKSFYGGAITDYFAALNGVKQGAVLSFILYCVYVDDLLLIPSMVGVGCFIFLHFVGALA